MPNKKKRPNSGFDYASSSIAPGYPGSIPSEYGDIGDPALYPPPVVFPTTVYPYGYQGYMYGYGSGYSNAYGSGGHLEYIRKYDPSYDSYFTDGPSVEDKWKSTYPYVPTAYANSAENKIEGRGTFQRRRGGEENRQEHYHSNSSSQDSNGAHSRESWGNPWEFLFSGAGYIIGVSNLIRFPGVAFQNGGGAFLVAYFVLLVFIGQPIHFIETIVGQFSSLSPLKLFRRLCPVTAGLGISMCLISVVIGIYHNVVLSYSLSYLFFSFVDGIIPNNNLPWISCPNGTSLTGSSFCLIESASFWRNEILAVSSGNIVMNYKEPFNSTVSEIVDRAYVIPEMGQIGAISILLVSCLAIAYLIPLIVMALGIKSISKFAYFSSTLPYFILVALLVKGLLLEGSSEGIILFFTPDWSKLLNIATWVAAAEHMIYSLSISWGGVYVLSSYNKFHSRSFKGALVLPWIDFLTSIFCSIVVFAFIGHIIPTLDPNELQMIFANKYTMPFVFLSGGLGKLSVSHVWICLVMLLIYTLGVDTQIFLIQTLCIVFQDSCHCLKRFKLLITFSFCSILFLLSIPCVSNAGIFVVYLMDNYGSMIPILTVCFLETVTILWVYGVDRFAEDLSFMVNLNLHLIVKLWFYVIPVLSLAMLIGSWHFFLQKPLTFIFYPNEVLHLPVSLHVIGWILLSVILVPIPLLFLFQTTKFIVQGRGRLLFSPEQKWGPRLRSVHEDWTYYRFRRTFRCKQHPNAWMAM